MVHLQAMEFKLDAEEVGAYELCLSHFLASPVEAGKKKSPPVAGKDTLSR